MSTEWVLQRELTERWLTEPLTLRGKRLFLLAWEVMSNWQINDAHVEWDKPSIDFLLLDEDGHIVAAELKPRILSPRAAWSALRQVTHRAHALAETFSRSRLEHVYDECCSDRFGRVSLGQPGQMAEAHAKFFGRASEVARIGDGPVRRLVLAQEFGSIWSDVLERFNREPANQVGAFLMGTYNVASKANREMKRFIGPPDRPGLIRGPVAHKLV